MKALRECVWNGNMEINDGWNTLIGSTNGQSQVQVHSGAYSWGATANQFTGIRSDTWSSVTGVVYEFSAWIYNTTSQKITIKVRKGDDSGLIFDTNFTGLTGIVQNQWSKISKTFTETAGGSGAYMDITTSPAEPPSTWYVDNVSISSQILGMPDPYYKKVKNDKRILILPDNRI